MLACIHGHDMEPHCSKHFMFGGSSILHEVCVNTPLRSACPDQMEAQNAVVLDIYVTTHSSCRLLGLGVFVTSVAGTIS